jgi:hypothetical protein
LPTPHLLVFAALASTVVASDPAWSRASSNIAISPPSFSPPILSGPPRFSHTRVIIRLAPGVSTPTIRRIGDDLARDGDNNAKPGTPLSSTLEAHHAQSISPIAGTAPANAELARACGLDRYFIVNVPTGTDLPSLSADLSTLAAVESVELDCIGSILSIPPPPDDPDFPLQWGLLNTGAPVQGQNGTPGADTSAVPAWQNSQGCPSNIIAILDTGVSQSHPDVAPKLVPGINTSGGDPADTDDSLFVSHGTACAGIAAAVGNDGVGIAGMDWNARIMPVKVANLYGYSSESQCAAGLIFAADHGADVASISLGFSEGSDFFHSAVQYAHAAGLFICAAAGNTPGVPIYFPARWPEVVAVGATDNNDELAIFETTGPEMCVCAPGVDVLTCWDTSLNPNSWQYETGTSMACPLVAGLASLLWSVNPALTNDQIRFILELTADDRGPPGWDPGYGYGRINAARAVHLATGGGNCGADWNHDDQVTSQDVFDFIHDYFNGNADFNNDGVTTSDDFFLFITVYFSGC